MTAWPDLSCRYRAATDFFAFAMSPSVLVLGFHLVSMACFTYDREADRISLGWGGNLQQQTLIAVSLVARNLKLCSCAITDRSALDVIAPCAICQGPFVHLFPPAHALGRHVSTALGRYPMPNAIEASSTRHSWGTGLIPVPSTCHPSHLLGLV